MNKLNFKNYRWATWHFTAIILFLGGLHGFAFGQQWTPQDDGCGAVRWMGNPSGAFNLEIKEQTIASPPKKISIDGGVNGGVRIRGWERNEIFVRACVQSAGSDQAEAKARTTAVRVETADGKIRAVTDNEDISFGASFDIRVPINTDLMIKTNNGGINLSNIRGSITFDLKNGGAIFNNLAGDLSGQTVNGSLIFNLSGDQWEGGGINTSTTNGNVLIVVPENYSARLETENRRGNFRVNFPMEKTREKNDQLNLDLGTGGAVIKAATINGQVSIQRQSVAKESKK